MGATLTAAHEKDGYCLADRGTYLAFRNKIALTVRCAGDDRLLNPYGIIAVSPARHPHAKYAGSMALIAWLTSPDGQKRIGDFRVNGEVLFHPSAYGRIPQ
jgi:tungstate transport system substrate-binding protein